MENTPVPSLVASTGDYKILFKKKKKNYEQQDSELLTACFQAQLPNMMFSYWWLP